MRRLAPRPLGRVLEEALGQSAPAGLLPRIQALWPEVAGGAVAEESAPVSERDGTVTVACAAAVWAQELELLGEDLRERLNTRLGDSGEAGPVRRLRFVVRKP